MRNFKADHNKENQFGRTALLLLVALINFSTLSKAQCPPNIDFEEGNFNHWTCYTGYTSAVGMQNQISLSPSGPVTGRHTMYSANSGLKDPYGGFSVNCPNGSGHSIRLGNNRGGGEAEGISYEFTIPAGRNVYSLIYYYAVVFEDPNHQVYQQPRMEVEITNETDNALISCSSFTFIPYGTILPGFYESPTAGDDGTPVWCKNWSAVTINLNGMAGKTIKLFFKTADCTFRRHFGYAYIDVNSECSSEFVGATYCPDDTAIKVTGPYGYEKYTWYNNNFQEVIGNQQDLILSPPPSTGTTVSLQIIPYSGYGCLDTLYAKLIDTLTVRANAGVDGVSCNTNPLQIGSPPQPGLLYSWSPSDGLSDVTVSNPLATPAVTTNYVLTVRSFGGGCRTSDTVLVKASGLSDSLQLFGKAMFCAGYGDSAVLKVQTADTIQWYKDGSLINGASQFSYHVPQTGTYYAEISNSDGCRLTTSLKSIVIEKPRPGISYPVEYAVINVPLRLNARPFGTTYLWKPVTDLDNATGASTDFQGMEDQLYTIKITTATGCETVDTLMVKIIKGIDIYVPTAFTPNGDGVNELLRPTLMGITQFHFFRVFNRWGQVVFQTSTKYAGWDGKINGVPQVTAAYVWVAEGIGVDGKLYRKKGTSILIR